MHYVTCFCYLTFGTDLRISDNLKIKVFIFRFQNAIVMIIVMSKEFTKENVIVMIIIMSKEFTSLSENKQ